MNQTTFPKYIAALPAPVRRRLQAIKKEVGAVVPDADISISYGIPAFSVNGKRFFYVAAWKEHIAVYPVTSGSEAFMKAVQKYRGTKSALHFPHDAPLPMVLLRRVIRACHRRYRSSGNNK